MRIGVMLRHFEQKEGGVKVYTRSLLPRLFSLGAAHQFILIYQNPALVGTYGDYPNVEETSLTLPGSVLWDQVGIPRIAARQKLDLVFNPKFTVPLLGSFRKAFVLHGSEWFVIPHHFLWYDRLYLKLAVPLYLRAANALIAVSYAVRRDALRCTRVAPAKVTAIQNGYDTSRFRLMHDRDRLRAVSERYRLPERFVLWAGQIESRKNIGRLLQAFARAARQIPHTLVIAGAQRFTFPMAVGAERELQLIDKLGLRDRVHFAGWVSHEDLPALYNLAELFLLPSLHEGFGIPLLEAMACGCPIVTANTCAPPEVTDGAAFLVDPLNIDSIAWGIKEVLRDKDLRTSMIARGLERSRDFSWERCAREVLAFLESLAPARSEQAATGARKDADASQPAF
jgi:O-antigen biosynthesis alpha-1,2-mannosyltransferase